MKKVSRKHSGTIRPREWALDDGYDEVASKGTMVTLAALVDVAQELARLVMRTVDEHGHESFDREECRNEACARLDEAKVVIGQSIMLLTSEQGKEAGGPE